MELALVLAVVGGFSFGSEFGLGADYLSQAYKVGEYDTLNWEWEEEDTLDIETEGRGFWTVSLDADQVGRSVDASNTVNLTTRSMRDQLSVWFRQELGPVLELEAGNDAEVRYYHVWFPSLADTTYSKDYLNDVARVKLEWNPVEDVSLGVDESFELLKYAEPDSYSYDYIVNRLGFEGSKEFGLLTSLDAEYEWSRRWARTQPSRNYSEHDLRSGFDHYFDSGLRLGMTNDLVRRSYPSPQHSYWEENLVLSAGEELGSLQVDMEEEARWTWYDSTTEVYSDLFENSLELTGGFEPGPELSIKLGPRYDFGVGLGVSRDEDYREISLVFGLDFFKLDRFWISVEDRLGRRNYPYADSAYQSSYAFNELSLLLNWTILATPSGELNLEGMVNIAPEWHTEKSDNFTFGVYSLELRYSL